jgi:hypothetical protein
MKVIIKEGHKNKPLQAGDIVTFGKDTYIIIKEKNESYIAKGVGGLIGATGHHSTLERLEESLSKMANYKHYSQEYYNLVLERK